jgi:tol-pal system protein YbgF
MPISRINMFKIGAVLCSAFILAGCYGGKLVKMPVNTDLTARRLDTLQTRQQMILNTLSTLTEELRIEREERMQADAGSISRLSGIEEALDILSNKIDDSLQLIHELASRRSPARPPSSPGMNPAMQDSSQASSSGGGEDAEGLIKAASTDLTMGNYPLAIQGFKNYIQRYPSGARLDEARYYLGECYYSSEQLVEAVAEYQLVIKEYPNSRLIPAAFLKTGLCYEKMDELSLAEQSYRELISQFPHSEEAGHAKAALEGLGE